jgi:uncharacterized protein YbjT (DUF2867 family)
MYLVTGAGGGVGSVSTRVVEALLSEGEQVRAMVHREDGRANRLRQLGAEVVVGDLTDTNQVVAAMRGVSRMFFNMSVSQEYLTATAVVCAAALEGSDIGLIVNMSQMTVSQMTLTSSEESRQQRLHWLCEHIMNWSSVPVVHIRPTVFLDNPLFTVLAQLSIRERGELALPFGTGRTSPIGAADVARVATTLLHNRATGTGEVYELTGPELLNLDELAERYARALNRPVTAVDIDYDEWVRHYLHRSGLVEHVQQHIATMARLHREGRYARMSDDFEKVTGQPPQTVDAYIAAHPESYS